MLRCEQCGGPIPEPAFRREVARLMNARRSRPVALSSERARAMGQRSAALAKARKGNGIGITDAVPQQEGGHHAPGSKPI